jgi:hypothetical protein
MAFQAPTSTDFARFIWVYKLTVEKIHACMDGNAQSKLCIFHENINNCQEILQYKFSKT